MITRNAVKGVVQPTEQNMKKGSQWDKINVKRKPCTHLFNPPPNQLPKRLCAVP